MIFAALTLVGGVIGWATGLFEGEPPTIAISVTIEDIEAEFNERAAEGAKELNTAAEADRKRLEGEMAEIARRLTDIEGALKERKTAIRDVDVLLTDASSEVSGERLQEARAALSKGDFSKADEIFAEIEASAQAAVQSAARAAYGRGEIAKEQIRWADAAAHYARAAGLDPTYDALIKAREFAWRAGGYAKAEDFGAELIRVAREEFGDDSPELATALNDHALTLWSLKKYAEAEPLYRQALEIAEKTIGTEHPDYATYLNNNANLLRDMGHRDEAERLFRKALEITAKTLGTEHPNYVGGLNNLANLLREDMERHDEAERLFRRALEIGEKTIGAEHPHYAILLNNLANLLQDMGRYDEAEPLFRQALEIDAKTIGTAHPEYAKHLNNLANLLWAMGRPDEAAPFYVEALEIFRAKLGPDHPNTRTAEANYAAFLADRDGGASE